MFEGNDKDLLGGSGLDLGSDIGAGFEDFTAFDNTEIGNIFGNDDKAFEKPEDIKKEENVSSANTESAEQAAIEGTETEVKQDGKITEPDSKSSVSKASDYAEKADETPNFFAAAISKAEEIQAENTKSGLTDKLPVFLYGSAKEEIVDTSKTFDALRIEKAEDFPELDDGTAVSWKMLYGTITKAVATPKKTTIASMKKQIEESKEFTTMLKKAKGDVECKVTPSVVAKKKGTQGSYKGAFLSMDEAKASGKVISFVPSDDGNVYEVRANRIGTFIAKANNVTILNKVRAGFIPALPKIPYKILEDIISFFKSYITYHSELEALAYIYWSVSDSKYYVYVPKQQVSKISVDATLPEMDEEKFPLVMEIHSHNTMPAVFSSTDNKDERMTRLYAVVGKLDNFFPDIKVRCSVGGKFVEVDPKDVFDSMESDFPSAWKESVESVKRGNFE